MANEWMEISLTVPAVLEDEVAALFVWAGASGVEVRDRSTLFFEPEGSVRVVAWVEQGTEFLFMQRLVPVLGPVTGQEDEELSAAFRQVPIRREEWNEFWKKTFDIQKIGRFIVRPSWKEAEPGPGETVFCIDPGMAFGTGLHATTRLVLEYLGKLPEAGFKPSTVLDMGCGTGILAMAAAVLYPKARVIAVDNDPDAVETALGVLADNGMSDRVSISLTSGDLEANSVDLLLANIQLDVLLELNPFFLRILAPGGRMVFSGLLNDQVKTIREQTPLVVLHGDRSGEWELVVFGKSE